MMEGLQLGDKVKLRNHSDPAEVFTIVGFRAHGKLADLKSPNRTQRLCAPVGALYARTITLHIEPRSWWRVLFHKWGDIYSARKERGLSE